MRSNDSAKVMRSALEAFVPSFEYRHDVHMVILSQKPYLPVQMQSRESWTVWTKLDQVCLNIGYGNEFKFWMTTGQWYFVSYHDHMPCSAPVLKMLIQRLEALDVPELSSQSRNALRQFLHAAAHLPRVISAESRRAVHLLD